MGSVNEEHFNMADIKSKDWEQFKKEHDIDAENVEQNNASEEDELESNESSESSSNLTYAELQEQYALVQKQASEYLEQSLRASAEGKNAKRRADMEIEKAIRFGLEKFVDSLIPVVDSLEQALQLAEKEQQTTMVEGLTLTLKLFLDAFKKQSVEQISPEGCQFDPQEHEAMSIQDSPDVEPNSVIFVVQKGYKLNGRIVRPARVIVAKSN